MPDMQLRYTAQKGFHFLLGAAGSGRWGKGGRGGHRQKQPRDLEEEEEEGNEDGEWGTGCGSEQQGTGTAQQQGRAAGGGRGQQQEQGPVRVPPGFVVLQRSGRSVQVTTNELNALNSRLRDAHNDCLVLTEQVGGCRERKVGL